MTREEITAYNFRDQRYTCIDKQAVLDELERIAIDAMREDRVIEIVMRVGEFTKVVNAL